VTIGAQPATQLQVDKAELPDAGGPSAMFLTLGGLLAALGAALIVIAHRGRR
jgi:hypothetical protein